ncbi:hypothetical protein HKD37_04G010880 [Glycine soja]
MCKKEHESFKEYAQRWRDLATQVPPLMMEREMITMIVDTLSVFYYENIVGYMPSSFADLVFTNERIKVGLRRGKFDYPALMNRKLGENGENKKEGETHVVATVPTWPNFPLAQQYQYSPISVFLITHHPTSQEHPIIHKGHPQIGHKIHPMHIQDQTPPLIPIKTPTKEGISRKETCRIHPNSNAIC